MAGRLSFVGRVAASALAVAALPIWAAAAERVPAPPRLTTLEAAVEALFTRAAYTGIAAAKAGEPNLESESMPVLIVRVKDGKPVLACVDTKEAAIRFINAPVEKIGAQTAEEK